MSNWYDDPLKRLEGEKNLRESQEQEALEAARQRTASMEAKLHEVFAALQIAKKLEDIKNMLPLKQGAVAQIIFTDDIIPVLLYDPNVEDGYDYEDENMALKIKLLVEKVTVETDDTHQGPGHRTETHLGNGLMIIVSKNASEDETTRITMYTGERCEAPGCSYDGRAGGPDYTLVVPDQAILSIEEDFNYKLLKLWVELGEPVWEYDIIDGVPTDYRLVF